MGNSLPSVVHPEHDDEVHQHVLVKKKMFRPPSTTLLKKVLVLGLDRSGKSTLIHSLLRSEPPSFCIPTNTFEVSSRLKLDANRSIVFMDSPGSRQDRALWQQKMNQSEVCAVLFVVDVSDEIRFPLVAKELAHLMKPSSAPPIFLLGNKIDLCKGKKMSQILQKIQPLIKHYNDSEAFQNDNDDLWSIKASNMSVCTTQSVEAMEVTLDWLVRQLKNYV